MSTIQECRHLSIAINQSAARAYEFLCKPENFPKWATGLGRSLERVAGQWVAETPEGPMRVRFSEHNAHGVLDHWVSPPQAPEIYIPLRVIANGDGCELMLTVFRRPQMSDAAFAADAAWVMRDLATAKRLLEAL
jgi:hypothetical protein